MKTASFFTYKGPGRISIACYGPRLTPSRCHYFPALAPPRDNGPQNGDDGARYLRDVLGQLDPQDVWDRLHALAGDAEPVLVCWERPPARCHRYLVAEWFARTLGYQVDEFEPPAPLLALCR